MAENNKVHLTRREIYEVMTSFEEEAEVDTSPDQLEDITSDLFQTLTVLEGTQMLCNPNFDLNDSMSSFEVMDPKMDCRMHRKLVLTPKKAQA